MQVESGSAVSREDQAAGSRSRKRSSRRILAVSLGISGLLHVVLLGLYPSIVRRLRPERVAYPFPSPSSFAQGVDVIRLVELDPTFSGEPPDDPTEIEDVEEPEAPPGPPSFGVPGIAELTPPPPTGAERLRPRFSNPRLWVIEDPLFSELSLEQREELIVAGRLEAWFDSVTAAAAAEAALTDWTFTDANGKRWGISPGQIHLGDITLPMPLAFGTPVGKRDEVARRMWEWEEITRQGARVEVEESWRDRAEAIRARRDRERAAQPDTLRSRR